MRKAKLFGILALVLLCATLLAGCGGTKHAVTFYDQDGKTVIKTVNVADGEKVEKWTPEKEGFEFIGWYATPLLKRPFDFDAPIKDATKAFASWKSANFVEDTRAWMIAGESPLEGAPMNPNNWGKLTGDARKPYLLEQKAGTNEFSLTLDLYVGDIFQLADIDSSKENFPWTFQRGYGYLTGEIKEFIKSAGNIFSDDLTRANIEIIKSGNYTLTLTTEVSNAALDTIEITRNGDPSQDIERIIAPNLSGSVTGGNAITDPANFGDFGLTERDGKPNNFETTISLNKGDFFAVLLSANAWNDALRTSAVLEDQSDDVYDKARLDNVVMTESAKYRISVIVVEDEGKYTGSITIKKVGAFERTAGDNEVRFHLADGNAVTSFVRKGARIPDPGLPTIPEGKIFLGWYSDLANNVPQSLITSLNVSGQVLDLSPKFLGKDETDTRDVYLKGSMNGWKEGDANFKMTNGGKHTYTFTLKITDKTNFMMSFFEGKAATGLTANGSWVDYENSTGEAGGSGDITLKSAGTYTITLDSFTQKVTIAKA